MFAILTMVNFRYMKTIKHSKQFDLLPAGQYDYVEDQRKYHKRHIYGHLVRRSLSGRLPLLILKKQRGLNIPI